MRRPHAVLWAGLLFLALLGAFTFAYQAFGLNLITSVLNSLLAVLPADDIERFHYLMGLSAIIFLGFAMWLYSCCWLQADFKLWRTQAPRQRLLARAAPMAVAFTWFGACVLGLMAAAWIFEKAVASRILSQGYMEHHLFAISCLIIAICASPLVVRLWHLPAIAAIEPGSVGGPWRTLLGASHGKAKDMFLSFFLQGTLLTVLGIGAHYAFADIAADFLEQARHLESMDELVALFRSEAAEISVVSALAFCFCAGPLLSIVAAMQVAVVRGLIGIPSEGGEVGHFVVTDEQSPETQSLDSGSSELEESQPSSRGQFEAFQSEPPEQAQIQEGVSLKPSDAHDEQVEDEPPVILVDSPDAGDSSPLDEISDLPPPMPGSLNVD